MKARILKLPLLAALAATLSLCVGCNEQTAGAEENVPAAGEVGFSEADIIPADGSDVAVSAVPTNAWDASAEPQ